MKLYLTSLTLSLLSLIGWNCYIQLQLYNQELIQRDLVKEILELKSDKQLNKNFVK